MQDRYMVYAKHAIGSEILLGRPDELLGDVGQMEARFGFFGNNANLNAR
jgi:hypothetical protein